MRYYWLEFSVQPLNHLLRNLGLLEDGISHNPWRWRLSKWQQTFFV